MSDVQREGDEILAHLPALPDARWGVTNLGGGWTITLTRTSSFEGATADEAVRRALLALPRAPQCNCSNPLAALTLHGCPVHGHQQLRGTHV